ncbi:Methyltransferase domain-containing protein [Eubacterium ruminantium]|nr:Methyltransferase domain-containing protein [Eubacterium ruminantium]
MKKGDIVEGIIDKFSFPNKGSMMVEDKRVTVKGTIPGQTVRGRIIKKKAGLYEAAVVDTIKPSSLETKKPLCPHFFECGGCTYQTLSYANQLRVKENMVKELLDGAIKPVNESGALTGPDEKDANRHEKKYIWEGIIASPSQWHYRNKMEFTFGDAEKDGPLTLGLHRQYSNYDILPIEGCAIVNNSWNEILKYTQKFFREKKVSFYKKMQHTGILRNLVIRQSAADGGILINLVTTTKHALDVEEKKRKPVSAEADESPKYKLKLVGENEDETVFDHDTEVDQVSEGAADKYLSEGLRNEIIEELCLPEYVAGLVTLSESGKLDSLENYSRITGILYTENDSVADFVQSDSTTVLYGRDYLIEEVLGLEFKISPFSFFQTNTRGCEVLYSKVREYVLEALNSERSENQNDPGKENSADTIKRNNTDSGSKLVGTVFDLYSGTGTIAQLMSPVAEKVIGIEIVEEAVEAAKENAKRNKLKNCEFIAGDVLKKLDEVKDKPDLIILDPPRDGIHPKALTKIIDYGVKNIVYISCKPTSLARDLVVFQENGYEVVKTCAVDEFPNTQHVETIILLQRTDS